MTPRDLMAMASDSLRANPLRSVLTTLGIIIGVAAVIAMTAIGAGAEQRVQTLISQLGTNTLTVMAGPSRRMGVMSAVGEDVALTIEDARAIEAEIAGVAAATPYSQASAQLISGNLNWQSRLLAVEPAYFAVKDWEIDSGRLLTDQDLRGALKTVVIGETVAEELFGGADPIGAMIRVNRVPMQIVGVLKGKGQTPFGLDQDDSVFVPLSTGKQRLLSGRSAGGDRVERIDVRVTTTERLATIEDELVRMLRARQQVAPGAEDPFRVMNFSQMLEMQASAARVLTLLLGAVASVSLLVGGIGIMNIMLVSVTERTREIGLRMAVGASSAAIQAQFVVEALLLSLIGGLIGVALGIGLALLIANFADWPSIISAQSVLIAFGFAAAIGLFFGYYPARKAAALDPIQALRHE